MGHSRSFMARVAEAERRKALPKLDGSYPGLSDLKRRDSRSYREKKLLARGWLPQDEREYDRRS